MFHSLLRFVACVLLLPPYAIAAAQSQASLEAEIAELSQGAGGVVGVAAWRLDGDGPRVLVNAGEPFPMASTFKIAVAGAVLAAVDAGHITLERMIAIDHDDHVPSDVIADRFVHPGVSLSVANLLELMLTQSDNTATDVLMDLVGGARAVTGWLDAQGVSGLRVDRDTGGLLRDFFELPEGPFLEALAIAEQADPRLVEKGAHPNAAFDNDFRDTSTPEAMGDLLTRIFRGRALEPASTKLLVSIMERCRTGDARIRGRLPAGTVVAAKTGTIGGTVNDVGVITLPAGRGQIVIAVFIKESDRPFEQRERAIAEIARSVRDFYLFAGS